MKRATASQVSDRFTHRVTVRRDELTAGEPAEDGGDELGPSPQELLAASLFNLAGAGRAPAARPI